MADKEEAKETTTDRKLKALVKKAEALLHPAAGGYDHAAENYDAGVQAVIDLLRSELE